MKKEKFVLIDGHALIHRAYHAIPPLSTKEGIPVNAVYGFTLMLLNVIRELSPKYLIVAFDLPGKTKRHEEYDQYKANRVQAPDDLVSQFEVVRDVVRAFSIPAFSLEGYEADDVIGTITKKTPREIENIIVTGDMDELQLVNSNTKVFTMKRGFTDTVLYDEAMVYSRYSLTPEQFVDYKALRGDPSDNIPGVAGIGEKTATSLLVEFGSLDKIYENLSSIKPAVAKKLESGKESAYMSQSLATIETGLPIELDIKKCVLHEYEKEKVFDIFQQLGFKSLIPRLPDSSKKPPQAAPRKRNYTLIDSKKHLSDLARTLASKKEFAIDTETTSISEVEAKLVGISVSFKKDTGFYIPVGHVEGTQIELESALEILRPVLENPNIKKIGHNIKYDYVVLKNHGVTLKGNFFDTMIAAFLVNPIARAQKLDDLAFSELGVETIKISELIGTGKNQLTFDMVPIEKALDYAAEDADIAWQLYEPLKKDLEKTELSRLNQDIESPLIPILGDMELAGIKLDTAILKKLAHALEKKIITLDKNIRKYAGKEININSPAQLQKTLFEELRLQEKLDDPREIKKLKSGLHSTSAQELEKLRGTHPIIDFIFEYRELTKLKNTYIDVLPGLVSARTGRIHTSFNQTVAQTGRLSSSDPNLQNIPIKSETGREIRKSFVASPGFVILSADYSQIELRVIAHIADDPIMKKIFLEKRDIHTETAAGLYNMSEKEVTGTMRRAAKIVNFGIIYGVSAHGLHQQVGVTREEGQRLITRYFEMHPKIKDYSTNVIEQAKELGYVETIFGRRRYLPDIHSKNFAVRGAAERMAINMPVQGTAADLLKLAMIDLAASLPNISPRSRMILQVHDELVFEIPKKDAKKASDHIQKTMNEVVKLSVPIETSVAMAENWGDAK